MDIDDDIYDFKIHPDFSSLPKMTNSRKFGANIHALLRMICNNFNDLLIFPLSPSLSQHFNLCNASFMT